jgi:hypothetical protein
LEGIWRPGINIQIPLKGNDRIEKYSISFSDSSLKDEVANDWFFWRPIVNNILSYTEACQLDESVNLHELMLINAALDKRIAEEKAQAGRK